MKFLRKERSYSIYCNDKVLPEFNLRKTSPLPSTSNLLEFPMKTCSSSIAVENPTNRSLSEQKWLVASLSTVHLDLLLTKFVSKTIVTMIVIFLFSNMSLTFVPVLFLTFNWSIFIVITLSSLVPWFSKSKAVHVALLKLSYFIKFLIFFTELQVTFDFDSFLKIWCFLSIYRTCQILEQEFHKFSFNRKFTGVNIFISQSIGFFSFHVANKLLQWHYSFLVFEIVVVVSPCIR